MKVRRFKPVLSIGILLFIFWYGCDKNTQSDKTAEKTFINPLYPGADPWMVKHDGSYYFCESRSGTVIAVSKSPKITEKGVSTIVWTPPPTGMNSREIWAPELHYFSGKWYIYYAADDGENKNHRMWVLESDGDDPQGPYHYKGVLYTGDDINGKTQNRWAIDGTVMEHKNQLYFIWSGWPSTEDVQYLYIARMDNHWTISSSRVLLCDNATYVWERVSESHGQRGLNEGPEVVMHGDKVFIIYSCSGSWETTYKLNMLYMDSESDPMNPDSWTKSDTPVFSGTEMVLGVGHASFVKSPNNREDWILFHSKVSPEPGWDRTVWAQKFTWQADGFPAFGTPYPPGTPLAVPSGE
jgi:GH43 family beta-xylosidase